MAKKLITDYEIVPASDIVKIKGKWKAEQLLLITNVDSNAILYNFASSGSGSTAVSYDSATEFTSVTLEQDLSSLTTSTKLQIFVDDEYTVVDFPESFYDPVNKFRVSNPENLIDTDFEYGLQSSKWETLELVNNIPSYHSTTGDSSIAGIVSVTATSGSDLLTVRTQEAHSLTIGTPIDVRGLSSVTAEGNFLISAVPSATEFSYKAKTQSAGGDISGVYTAIVAGRFFSGSALDYERDQGIVSDGASQSSLTINTSYAHGFKEGTEIYLINTLGVKKIVLDDVSSNASDGRPFVDHAETKTSDILSKLDLTKTETKAVKGCHSVKFNESAVNYSANTITWTAHGMRENDCVLYMAPMGAEEIAGLNRMDIYYVDLVDANTIGLKASATGSRIAISSGGSWAFGQHQLMLSYEIRGMLKSTNTNFVRWRTTAYTNSGIGSGWDLIRHTDRSRTNWTELLPEQPQHYLMVGRTGASAISSTYWYDYYHASKSSTHNFPTLSTESSTSADYRDNPIENADKAYSTFYSGFSSESGFFGAQSLYFASTGNNYTLHIDKTGFTDYSNSAILNLTSENYYIIPLIKDSAGNSLYIEDHGLETGNSINLTTSDRFNTTVQERRSLFSSSPLSVNQSGNDLPVIKLSDDRIKLQDLNLHYVTPPVSALSSVSNNATANSFFFANHGFNSGDKATISTANSGVIPTVNSGDIVYTGKATELESIFAPMKAEIDTWTTTNSSKLADTVINGDPITFNQRPSDIANDTQHTIQSVTVYSDGNSFSTVSGSVAFGGAPDGQAVTLGGSTNVMMVGQNVNEDRATVDYGLNIFSSDPVLSVRGTRGKRIFVTQYGRSSDTQVYNLNRDTVINGIRHTCSAIYVPPTNVNKGFVSFMFAFQRDTWDTDTTYTPGFSSLVRDYGSYAQQRIFGNRGFDTQITLHLGFTLAANQSFSLSDAEGLRDDLLGVATTGLSYPTLSSGDEVFIDVLSNDRFRTAATLGGLNHDLSSSGTADITFETQQPGAIDGTYKVNDVPTETSYELEVPFQVNARTIVADDTNVDTVTDTITITDHGLQDQTKINYVSGTISGLAAGTDYYAIVLNNNDFQVASSTDNAASGTAIDLTAVTTGSSSFSIDSIAALTKQEGVVTTTSGSKIIKGDTDSLFKRYWKRGDEVLLLDDSVTPNQIVTGVIDVIPTDGEIHLEQEVDFTSTTSRIFRNTEVYVRPNGSFQHRPFDGGVEIQTGTSPNSAIVRQTRKYFRYQSGKGIQTSYAINFNPPTQAETITGSGTTATVTTKYPHGLVLNDGIEVVGSLNSDYNGNFTVGTVPDEFTFTYEVAGADLDPLPNGFIQVYVNQYQNSYVRAGMFDYQNGFFYEFDGQDLYCVRRSSTQQLSGTAIVNNRSHRITGLNTNFLGQVAVGDHIVVRGQTYKITAIPTNTSMDVQPAYRGVNASGVILTKTEDVKVRQADWNIDTCDGNGKSGFDLDLKKIQMCYMDYSWYGAGKIRFGFKDTYGHVVYTHEFIHNNRLIESYFRSGNLPARYEVGTLDNPQYKPNLFHWGTSVMMDGTFDEDEAYLFTANSNNLTFSNGQSVTATTTNASFLSFVYNFQTRTFDWYLSIPFNTTEASKLTSGTQLYTTGGELTGEKIEYTQYESVQGTTRIVAKVYITSSRRTPNSGSYPSVNASTIVSIGAEANGTAEVDLGNDLIPIISIRLAPSVDGGLVGALGERDIINRMQLKLNTIGMVLTHDCEVSLILNSDLSTSNFEGVGSPSLCQLIKHSVGDAVFGGSKVFQFRASGGQADSSGQNAAVTSNFELGDIIDLGNSILGGDGVYPNGADLLTVAVKLLDTSGVDATNKFIASGRISWAESQA